MEFILRHRLCKSESTGEIIKDDFLRFGFPVRWKYDILCCLDLFRECGMDYDPRMDDALYLVRPPSVDSSNRPSQIMTFVSTYSCTSSWKRWNWKTWAWVDSS